MTKRELDAAGIRDPHLRAAYTWCRGLNARHGRTYFLATRMLTAPQRPAVHALYGFARWLDDIVDEPIPVPRRGHWPRDCPKWRVASSPIWPRARARIPCSRR